MSSGRVQAGFTLLETVVAMTLLAVMLAILFGGLRTGARAWQAGSDRGDRADQVLLTASFLRKELTATFPWRFRDPQEVKLAFLGAPEGVRFVSMRPADLGGGGLAFVSLAFEPGRPGEGGRLVMRRVPAAFDAVDFSAVDSAKGFALLDGVIEARFQYFGAENDLAVPAWRDKWEFTKRIPTHVRIEIALAQVRLPDVVVALRLGEEAGCPEIAMQRNCMPRR